VTAPAAVPSEAVGYAAILKSQPALIVVMATVAGHMLMMGSLAPILSLYGKSFGVSEWAIGVVVTIFGVGRLAVDIPAGLLAEKLGRKTLLWIGPAIACVASVGAALTDDYAILVVFRFFQGVGSGIYMTVATIVSADLSTPTTRGRVMALYQAALLTGAGLGPAVGGFVAEYFGLRAPFWMAAAIGLFSALYARFAFSETRSSAHGRHKDGHGLSALFLVVAVAPLAVLMFIQFGAFFTRSASQWTITPLLGHTRFGLEAGALGLALTLAALSNLAVLPWAGSASDRFGCVPVICVSTLLVGLSLFLIAVSWAPWMYWAGMVLMGIATGFSGPAIAAYAAEHAPGGRYGPTMGILRFAGDLGFVVGPVLLGLSVDFLSVGYDGALLINGALVVLSALMFVAVGWSAQAARARSKSPTPQPTGD
jgi:MFS family permease